MEQSRRKGRFIKSTKFKHYKSVTEAQRQRWQKEDLILHHSYSYSENSDSDRPKENTCDTVCSTVDGASLPDVASFDVVCSEHEKNNPRLDKDWRTGRRIIELGVLADGLSGCKKCGLPLQLSHCMGIITFGLAAMLKIPCMNTQCQFINNVPTGKRHNKVWDANSKLAAAVQHTGIGYDQISGILAELNVPPVSRTLLSSRQEEVGSATESVATETIQEALEQEVLTTSMSNQSPSITVSVDGAWQKRGSGRSYDSLTGHCSMIGSQTGKIVGYSFRNKSCRICERAEKNNQAPVPHGCKRNWTGSSKSMESDMVVEMVKSTIKKGIKVEALVGDDDTTTMSRIHREIDPSIKKHSDKNHIKKNISNSLYNLQKKHNNLSSKVIKYIQKSFNYMISQNQGNPTGIEKGLDALALHPFNDHSQCSEVWCHHKRNLKKKYNSLPYGRPLESENLKQDLLGIFNRLKKHTTNLANLGSTQANESFNKTVASKAPKSRLFSRTIGYRVAASVAQKNIGQSYLVEVNKRMGLSPGGHTKKLAAKKDSTACRKKALSLTKTAKRRRLFLKAERKQVIASKETREGSTYSSDIGLCSGDDNETIPAPLTQPLKQPLQVSKENPLIFFDLESTGLARNSHITQMAAVFEEEVFSEYVTPEVPITQKATEVTGITFSAGKMFCRNVEVNALKLTAAVDSILDFFSKFQSKVVLIGHNVKSFDCHLFLNAVEACGKTDEFSKCIAGFIDTKLLFRIFDSELKSYSQSELFKYYLSLDYSAHNALDDVRALQKLVNSVGIDVTSSLYSAASFTFSNAVENLKYSSEVHKNAPSLEHLVREKILSKSMANKIAGSGLNFRFLQMAYTRNPQDGILNLLSEQVLDTNHVRVTKSQKVISCLNKYFASKCES
ncbi:uncharacterized protein LOC133195733 [Saccostrea echinata]|uniref:uncharacterized protein LOC133194149 n=1 Tax=Saccostrea echinata TaxID=191078 RepID=UPI002A8111EA|nr:uncharacterized protein LOC133194149 [Saccostrea echinata]XP_061187642.1 uncharacterized protein LOC133195733 [Saccostrea echinata]